jgi:hypothetical protein
VLLGRTKSPDDVAEPPKEPTKPAKPALAPSFS